MHDELDFPPSEASARAIRVHVRYWPIFLAGFVLGMLFGGALTAIK